MPKANNHHDKGRFNGRRKYEIRLEYPTIGIYTEGEKTEPHYFNSQRQFLRLPSVSVKIMGTGHNTLSIVDYAISDIDTKKRKFDEVWIVFDKDSFGSKFDAAIKKAISRKFFVAYSNESFELWYRLHFSYVVTAQPRTAVLLQVKQLFKKFFKVSYDKSGVNHFMLLKSRQNDAIHNAKNLEKSNKNKPINPSTTVYKLVERLNKISKQVGI
jgi:hypothetical protein